MEVVNTPSRRQQHGIPLVVTDGEALAATGSGSSGGAGSPPRSPQRSPPSGGVVTFAPPSPAPGGSPAVTNKAANVSKSSSSSTSTTGRAARAGGTSAPSSSTRSRPPSLRVLRAGGESTGTGESGKEGLGDRTQSTVNETGLVSSQSMDETSSTTGVSGSLEPSTLLGQPAGTHHHKKVTPFGTPILPKSKASRLQRRMRRERAAAAGDPTGADGRGGDGDGGGGAHDDDDDDDDDEDDDDDDDNNDKDGKANGDADDNGDGTNRDNGRAGMDERAGGSASSGGGASRGRMTKENANSNVGGGTGVSVKGTGGGGVEHGAGTGATEDEFGNKVDPLRRTATRRPLPPPRTTSSGPSPAAATSPSSPVGGTEGDGGFIAAAGGSGAGSLSPRSRGVDEANISPRRRALEEAEEAAANRDWSKHVLSVHIHRATPLRPDVNVTHPVVAVHFVDINTGVYIEKSHPERCVTAYHESATVRDALAGASADQQVGMVLPILSKPFRFQRARHFTPLWDELLIFNEPFPTFVSPNVLMLLEVKDFAGVSGQADGWYKIAWGFLRLVPERGSQNVRKEVQLQLYKYKKVKNVVESGSIPSVFAQYTAKGRTAYPATIFVALQPKPAFSGTMVVRHKRPDYAHEEEKGRLTVAQMAGGLVGGSGLDGGAGGSGGGLGSGLEGGGGSGLAAATAAIDALTRWPRMDGQRCRIPNAPGAIIAGGSGGCFTVKFSSRGYLLAAAVVDGDSYPIRLHAHPSGVKVGELVGHCGLVYELAFNASDSLLLSASGDCSAKLWSLNDKSEDVYTCVLSLDHPSYVYSAQFHPTSKSPHVIATGAFDSFLRLWNADDGSLLRKLDGHNACINSVCFSKNGLQMYSGDGNGVLKVWAVRMGEQGHEDTVKRLKTLEASQLLHSPINCVRAHPYQAKIMAHARDNKIVEIELKRYTTVHCFSGFANVQYELRSVYSPCGNFVLSGSEDGTAYVWDVLQSAIVKSYKHLRFTTAIHSVDWHPFDHAVAFASYGARQPVLLYSFSLAAPSSPGSDGEGGKDDDVDEDRAAVIRKLVQTQAAMKEEKISRLLTDILDDIKVGRDRHTASLRKGPLEGGGVGSESPAASAAPGSPEAIQDDKKRKMAKMFVSATQDAVLEKDMTVVEQELKDLRSVQEDAGEEEVVVPKSTKGSSSGGGIFDKSPFESHYEGGVSGSVGSGHGTGSAPTVIGVGGPSSSGPGPRPPSRSPPQEPALSPIHTATPATVVAGSTSRDRMDTLFAESSPAPLTSDNLKARDRMAKASAKALAHDSVDGKGKEAAGDGNESVASSSRSSKASAASFKQAQERRRAERAREEQLKRENEMKQKALGSEPA